MRSDIGAPEGMKSMMMGVGSGAPISQGKIGVTLPPARGRTTKVMKDQRVLPSKNNAKVTPNSYVLVCLLLLLQYTTTNKFT